MAWVSNSLLISGVVLVSMNLQLVLAFGGSLRHRSSNRVLQLLLWLAYMSADAVAIYALGTMVHQSTHSRIFGVWAPLFLLHLGGPDTITAYSTVDNELWRRHLVTLLYQVLVAIYVMYLSEMKSYLLAAALILLLVGVSKYAEKTVALRLASYSQIVNYCQPLYKYISVGDHAKTCSYAVMGLKEWERNWNDHALTTIKDVWEYERQEASENYILCLSYALFRMNMRRYADLYIFESWKDETREFFFSAVSHLPSEKIFTVIEMELKFLYDALFSKSNGTAFSKCGTVMRIINISLLAVGGFLVYRELAPGQEKEEVIIEIQRTVTYIVISVALVVELLQLLRIIASDWTLVWLICSAIQHSSFKTEHPFKLKQNVLRIALCLLAKIRRLRGREYWKKSIQQYSLIHSCQSISSFIWKLAQTLDLADFVMYWYIKCDPIEDEFKEFITEKLKVMSSSGNSTDEWRNRISSYNANLSGDLTWASVPDHEHLILQWHIATTICEMEYRRETNSTIQQGRYAFARRDDPLEVEGHDNSDPETKNSKIKRNVSVSRTISNYCAYLLVSNHNLLPLHPDIARMESLKVHSELLDFLSKSDIQNLKDYGDDREDSSILENGAELARQLLNKFDVAERWEILSDYWAAVLIYYADSKKLTFHAEQLTTGGEFITQLWALLGHMGSGAGKD